MKKLMIIAFSVLSLLLTGCTQELEDRLTDLESRVEKLEELCARMNEDINALQKVVTALQNNDYVTSVNPIEKDGEVIGYTITFSKSGTVTIYHGKDGKDGEDGKDGYSPLIGVEKDRDGIYYWTLDGEWLLDDEGNKIPAYAQDGQNGADGKDGNTPELKIEDGFWWVSYDNGKNWTKLGKAVGEDGVDGQNGESYISYIEYMFEDFVTFCLANGDNIQIPTWHAFEKLQTFCNEMNTNLEALRKIVEALQQNDCITNVEDIFENGRHVGYSIEFSKSGIIRIYHGKDGENGKDGVDGADGKDGYTPVIGVRMDADNVYYWTLDGQWLLDENGNKVRASAYDGQDGSNGFDGMDGADGQDGWNGLHGQDGPEGQPGYTPELQIIDGYWYVKTSPDAEWQKLGQATGDPGPAGLGGDSVFANIEMEGDLMVFTLKDGSVFKVPTLYSSFFQKIQSIIYIPEYSDGIADVLIGENAQTGKVTLTFELRPKKLLSDLDKKWQEVLKLQAIYTKERTTTAYEFIDMPILSFTYDSEIGFFTITASGENLSQDFYSGNQPAKARLVVTSGEVNISSEYFSIRPLAQ